MESNDQTQSWTPFSQSGQKRKPSARLKEAILALGLRYHPSSSDMIEPHQLKLAALVEDLMDIPIEPLERACDHWKKSGAYLPKAIELITLAANFAKPRITRDTAAFYNDRMDENASGKERQDIRWVNDPDLMLMPLDQLEKIGGKWRPRPKQERPLTAAELAEVQRDLDRVNDPNLRGMLRQLAETIGLDVRI